MKLHDIIGPFVSISVVCCERACVRCCPNPNCRECDRLKFHCIVRNLEKNNWKKVFSFFFRTVCRSSPFDFGFLICSFFATIVRRNKDARNAMRVPRNGTHEYVSTPCGIGKEIKNIYSGGYGMDAIAISAERSKPNETERKKRISSISIQIYGKTSSIVMLSCSFLCHSIRCVFYTRPLLSQFIVIPLSTRLHLRLQLSANHAILFFSPLVCHPIYETDTRAKYTLFIMRQNECSTFGFDLGREARERTSLGRSSFGARNGSHVNTSWVPSSSFMSRSQTHDDPGRINEV